MTKTKRATRQRYVDWRPYSKPTQLIKKVWGLGSNKPCIDLTLIHDNTMLMDMDAPDVMPAGSTYREEHVFPEAVYFNCRDTLVLR